MTRMRKELLILLVVIVAFIGSFVLVRNLINRDNNPDVPDEIPGEATHQHEIDERKTIQEKAEGYERADCVNPGFYMELYFCSCGESMGEQLVYEAPLGHQMSGNECTRCGLLVESQGLKYVCVGASYYMVVGMGSCTDRHLIIPATYSGLPVKEIGSDAFSRKSFVSVFIPDSVSTIRKNAFNGCSGLKSVSLGNSVVSVEEGAFSGCTNIEYNEYGGARYLGNKDNSYVALIESADKNIVECEINQDTKVIAAGAFAGCGKLREITVPSRVKTIGAKAFYDCTNLLSVTLGSALTDIGDKAFLYCHKLVEVYDLSPVIFVTAEQFGGSYIGYYALDVFTSRTEESNLSLNENKFAFYDNGEVRYLMAYHGENVKIDLPATGDYEMYSHAFANLDIESADASAGPTSIGTYAFKNCKKLTSVLLPDGMTAIAGGAFEGCAVLNDIDIPAGVTSIGSHAFMDCKALTSMVLPAGVTAVSDYTFMGCTSLENVSANGTILNVGAHAFDGCASLCGFDLSAVSSVGDYAFRGCTSITDISFNSVKAIGDYAFSGVNISSLTIPTNTTSVGAHAFDGCKQLKQITVANGRGTALSFGNFAFANCPSLEKASLEGKVSAVSDGMFSGCALLSDITLLGSGITAIGNEAFYGCESLVSVILPSGVRTIGERAFSGCLRLGSIGLPSTLTSIDKHAFESCYNLMSITIPDGVTSIGDGAFYNCVKLVDVYVSQMSDGLNAENSYLTAYALNLRQGTNTNPGVVVQNGYVFYTHRGVNYLLGYIGNDSSITLPASYGGSSYEIYDYAFYRYNNLETVDMSGAKVTGIGDNAFEKCHSLTSVKLPDCLTAIGEYAFNECDKLSEVALSDNSSLAEIGAYAFNGCYALTEINLGNKLEVIGDYAFKDCDLTDLKLGESIAVIGTHAFENNTKLASVSILGAVEYIGDYAFKGCPCLESVTISAANGAVIGISAFEGALITEIRLPEGVVEIADNAFKNCVNVDSISLPASLEILGKDVFYATSPTSITVADGGRVYRSEGNCLIEIKSQTILLGCNLSVIPSSAKIIAPDAFRNCAQLEQIDLTSIIKIGDGAFNGCTQLANIIWGNNLVSLGNNAFNNCNAITSLVLPASLSVIGNGAFNSCSSLNSVVISSGIEVIGSSAFEGCDMLATLVISEGVKEIQSYAFADCDILVSVIIPEGVETIGSSAFAGCDKLEMLVINQGTKVIGSKAFSDCDSLITVSLPADLTRIEAQAFANCDKVQKIIVDGTIAQFSKVIIGSGNNIFSSTSVSTVYTKQK